MPKRSLLIQLSLVGTVLLGILIGVYLVVGRRFPKPDPAGKVIGHAIDTEPEDVLKYWTADKMRNAKPAVMPNAPEQGKKRTRRSQHTPDPEQA